MSLKDVASSATPLPAPPGRGNHLIDLQPEDVLPHPVTQSDHHHAIVIGGKSYDFSEEMVRKYPKLLDPSARYTLGFEAVLPLIYEYPPTVLPKTLLDEQGEKELFLSNCEFFDIKLSDQVILHLCSEARKELEDCVKHIGEKLKHRQKKSKVSFQLDKKVQMFCLDHEESLSEIYSDIKPLEIIQRLEAAVSNPKHLEALLIHDWKGKNCVMGFVKSFLKFFLA